eukprot:TRINITY_DN15103_c0_g1_i2.p2 TRINITY_DN15103_c0_g1~~TRINITY_DN15103_c0_g1_i2.p2  ORF type:complete len:191 (+),score=24.38 TRINITY_DN15103_c0_g1_i2:134-706(+)
MAVQGSTQDTRERREKWQTGVVHRIGDEPLILSDSGRVVRFTYTNVRRHYGYKAPLALGDRVEFITHSRSTRKGFPKAMQVHVVPRAEQNYTKTGSDSGGRHALCVPEQNYTKTGSDCSSLGHHDSAEAARVDMSAGTSTASDSAETILIATLPVAQPVRSPVGYSCWAHDPYSTCTSVKVRVEHQVCKA